MAQLGRVFWFFFAKKNPSLTFVSARLTLTIAKHNNPREAGAVRQQSAPDKGGKIFKSGRTQVGDFIEETMIQRITNGSDMGVERAEIGDHAGCAGLAAQGDGGAVGMAVNPAARLGFDRAIERVRGLEAEVFADFEHQGIPRYLCVCIERRHCGWAWQ
jgi:hypothetical protein